VLADLNRQKNQLKGTIQCTNCGQDMPTEADYCSKCGSKLEKPVKEDPVKEDPVKEDPIKDDDGEEEDREQAAEQAADSSEDAKQAAAGEEVVLEAFSKEVTIQEDAGTDL